jgi:hypothetical protein
VLPAIGRLPADWQAAIISSPLTTPTSAPRTASEAIPFDWAGETARHVGTLVHRYLERIAREGLVHWDAERINKLQPAFTAGLQNLGVEQARLQGAVAKGITALQRTLADDRGRWLLQAHTDDRFEWALTEQGAAGFRRHVIDRSFVDAEGTRWVIDYKSGGHEGSDVAAFLDQEQERYRLQLENYARVVRAMDPRPIRLALYHPQLGGWREWSADSL